MCVHGLKSNQESVVELILNSRLKWVSLTVRVYGLGVAFLSWVLKSGQMPSSSTRLVHLQLGMAEL